MVTNNSSNIVTAAAGKVLQGAGVGVAPTYSTPTYPSTSGTSRTMLVSDGTNNVYSTETWAVPGTSGNVLTSDGTNWTSAAPASQSAFSMAAFFGGSGLGSPADATTYYVGIGSISSTQTTVGVRTTMPQACTIKSFYGYWTAAGSPSSQSVSFYIRVNNTTDTTISTSVDMSGGSGTFNATGLSIAISAGDYIQLKIVTPTWNPTNPTSMNVGGSIYCE